MLAEARSHLVRLRPTEAAAVVEEGALLVDTRTQAQHQGGGSGSIPITLNVLEWRVDPDSGYQN